MRYAFDNQSVALINRVQSAAFDVPLSEYGANSIAMLGAFWLYADLNCDWSGETDHTMAQYPILESAHRRTIALKHDDPRVRMFHEADAIACEFENRLYLAMIVVNMVEAMEGGVRNIWGMEHEDLAAKVDKEFAVDRHRINVKIHSALEQLS